MREIVGMILGGLGIAANAIIFQQKTGKRLLVWKLISDVLWASYYVALGGYSGAAIALIGILRESIFLNQGKRWADSKLWLLLFAGLSVASAALTWQSAMSILPAVASLLSVFGFWRARPMLSRALAYPISGCMLTYDIVALGRGGVMGIVNESITLASTTFALIVAFIGHRRAAKAESRKASGDEG